jgi:hypothetical protein
MNDLFQKIPFERMDTNARLRLMVQDPALWNACFAKWRQDNPNKEMKIHSSNLTSELLRLIDFEFIDLENVFGFLKLSERTSANEILRHIWIIDGTEKNKPQLFLWYPTQGLMRWEEAQLSWKDNRFFQKQFAEMPAIEVVLIRRYRGKFPSIEALWRKRLGIIPPVKPALASKHIGTSGQRGLG